MMDLDCISIAEAFGLEPKRKSGNELLFICPCHDDHDPSLSINPKKNVWMCAPCDASGTAWSLAAFLLGCDASDKRTISGWLRRHGLLNGGGDSERLLLATYPYRDEQGKPLFHIQRFRDSDSGKKTFVASRYENGDWRTGLGQTRRVPYRLDEFLGRETVLILEGEKDVENAWKMEIPATCNPFGAGNWSAEYNQYFKGKSVVIIGDNDMPGQRHARDVARNLFPVAKLVKLVRLPDLSDHGDFSDWKAGGGTVRDFAKIFLNTPWLRQKDIEAWETEYQASGTFGTATGKGTEKEQDWPELEELPLLTPEAPNLSKELLPYPLADWIEDACDRLQVPLEYVAASAIVSASSVVGSNIRISPKQRDSWQVVPNLWGALIARPGTLKSPASTVGLGPLNQLVTEARGRYEIEQVQAEARLEVQQAKVKSVKDQMLKAAKKQDEDECSRLEAELINLQEEMRESETTERRYLTNDPTTEKLGELFKENPRGLLLYRDELSGWIKNLYKTGREGDREFYLESWNGTGSFTIDRIARGTIHVPDLCLSIYGNAQPPKFLRLVSEAVKGGWGDDGLLQRFQVVVYPQVSGPWVNIDRWPDRDAKERAYEVFQRLDSLTPGDFDLSPGMFSDTPVLHFSPEAQEFFNDWLRKLMNRIRSGEIESPAFESHLSKYRSLMPSLALISHLIELVHGDHEEDSVGIKCAERAVDWCEFLEQHARKVYAGAIQPDVQAAYALADRIRNRRVKDGCTERSIYKHHWSMLSTPDDVEAALAVLEECHWVRVEQQQTEGRPKTIVRLHPSLREGAA